MKGEDYEKVNESNDRVSNSNWGFEADERV